MIKFYQRIPHKIAAIRYTGSDDSCADVHAFLSGSEGTVTIVEDEEGITVGMYLNDGDSVINVDVGDYVVRDALGLFFSVEPDIFDETFEEIKHVTFQKEDEGT